MSSAACTSSMNTELVSAWLVPGEIRTNGTSIASNARSTGSQSVTGEDRMIPSTCVSDTSPRICSPTKGSATSTGWASRRMPSSWQRAQHPVWIWCM